MVEDVVLSADLPLPPFLSGKVRDSYDLGDKLLIVATDRISAFDSIMPNGIPGRGKVLTQLSAFWFRRMSALVPNHMLSVDPADYPFSTSDWSAEERGRLAGRSMLVRQAQRIDIECVVRGYISGSAWAEYVASGREGACGIALPGDLIESDRLDEPIFTPATKAETGHDENISYSQLEALVGVELAAQLRQASMQIYAEAAEYARSRGIIIADTKMEFGLLDGELILIDELLTPDSSRFWEAASYTPGKPQASLDKQYLRDWLLQSGWDREPPAPALPAEVVAKTAAIYREAYSRLTGASIE